jgi:hypothetical protein
MVYFVDEPGTISIISKNDFESRLGNDQVAQPKEVFDWFYNIMEIFPP